MNEPGSEAVFARWLEQRESGAAPDFAALLADHPAERAGLERLHEAWSLLCGAEPASVRADRDLELFAGRYRKERLLGRGGQGEVWLAEDTRLGRRVALKLVAHPDPDRMRRFAREAAVTSRLEHPNICAVYESGEAGGIAFIAMRYVEGMNLAQWIERERELWATQRPSRLRPSSRSHSSVPFQHSQIERIVRIVVRAARALDAAHQAGVLHRDVKPGNILVTKDDEPVLVDFGFAADTASDQSALTRTAQFLGTPAYMSPEQIQGKGRAELDRRTDVWSLGVTLYECLTGKRPFEGPTWQAIFRSIVEEEAASARSLHPALPADLEVILATALEKERERRYQSAAALASDLDAWLAGRPIAARKISWAGRLTRWARRERAIAALLALLALALPALGALATYAALTRKAVLAAERTELFHAIEDTLVEGFLALEHGDATEALALFERAIERGADEEALGGKLQALLKLGRRDEALATIDELTAGRPGRELVEARLLGHAGLSRERSDATPPISVPASASENFLLGWSAMPIETGAFVVGGPPLSGGGPPLSGGGPRSSGGDLETAVRHFRAAILLSSAPRLLYFLEYAHALGHLPGSEAELEMLVEVVRSHWPASARGRVVLAMALGRSNAERGIELAREAVALDPEFERASLVLGIMLAVEGDFDGAIAAYDRSLELDPGDANAHYNRALALRKKGDLHGAVSAYRASLALDPRFVAAWNNLGSVSSRLGDIDGAREAHAEAVRLDPTDSAAQLNLARDLQFGGDLEGALEAMRRGHQLATAEGWNDVPTAEWVADLEAMIRDRSSLDVWMAGETEPPLEEQVRLAERAYAMGRCEDSSTLAERLLAEHPELGDELLGGLRTTAAYAAAWLAHVSEGERAREWRARAIDHLWAELEGLERVLADDPSVAPDVAGVLTRWSDNPGTRFLLEEDLPADVGPEERASVSELATRVRELAAELQ